MNAQCEHEFALDPVSGEVRCIKCGDLDDEMQLPIEDIEERDNREKLNESSESQLNFE